jgi:hypothetical protein
MMWDWNRHDVGRALKGRKVTGEAVQLEDTHDIFV